MAYDNRIKTEMLGVPAALDRRNMASISAAVAEAMAVGCRTRFGTDLAVSTVGMAGPGGATAEKPVGLVYVGLAWDGGVSSQSWSWIGTREEVQSRTAKLALNQVRLHLLKSGDLSVVSGRTRGGEALDEVGVFRRRQALLERGDQARTILSTVVLSLHSTPGVLPS